MQINIPEQTSEYEPVTITLNSMQEVALMRSLIGLLNDVLEEKFNVDDQYDNYQLLHEFVVEQDEVYPNLENSYITDWE